MSYYSLFKKHRRALAVSAAVNVGSVLFGFDTGVAGAVISLKSFKSDFDLVAGTAAYTNVSSNIVAVLNWGAFLGSLIPAFSGHRIGRRRMLLIASFFFMLGGVLQTSSTYPGLGMLYAGRVISGIGVGMISNTAPVYVAEVAPAVLRGLLMSLFEMFLVSGGIIAYWTTYGCSLHLGAYGSRQWRVPLSLQIILATIVCLSSLTISESPRWLAKGGRWEEARATLAYLRDVDDSAHAQAQAQGSISVLGADSSASEDVHALAAELAEMKAQIDEELAAARGRTLSEFLAWPNLRRLLWGCATAVLCMWTGHNAILYYGPTVFAQIGFSSQDAALLASGVFTCIKFASTVIFCTCVVHFFKRKTLMVGGALFMGVFLFTLGALIKVYPPASDSSGTGGHTPAQKGMMASIYLFVVAYSVSWGPLQWIYIPEIFPTRLRDWAVAICVGLVWIMNYVVSKIAPIAVRNIGWKTWMIFGTMNVVASIFAIFLPETKGLTLEEMDVLFGVAQEDERRRDIEMELEGKGIATKEAARSD